MEKYRTLGELTKDELEELKESLLTITDDYEELIREYDEDFIDEERLIASLRIRKAQKVTYKDLELFYGGAVFVEDDFFCNCCKEEEEEKEEKREPLGYSDLCRIASKLRLSQGFISQGFYKRLYSTLSEMTYTQKKAFDEVIKSWKCYEEVELIAQIESMLL